MKRSFGAALAVLVTTASLAWSATAAAQDSVGVVSPPASPPESQPVMEPSAAPPAMDDHVTVVETPGPNRGMLISGLLVFGVSYGSALTVGLTSERDSDDHLVVPFAGPWLDLANREECGGDTDRSCDTETAYKVLLVTDGVFQAIGGVLSVGSFFRTEKRRVTTSAPAQPTFVVKPAVSLDSYGLTAAGVF